MESYFNIRYEFDRSAVHRAIAERLEQPGADYICVADGVILDHANRNAEYCRTVNAGMFSICDSSYVPLYIRWIYGRERQQYCGSEIFLDIVAGRRYRMFFMGAHAATLHALQQRLTEVNPEVTGMSFMELPFCDVDDFDYVAIARQVEADGADIIWVALGAPKQEVFAERLKAHLHHGVIIAVGAAFKFYSGVESSRAPQWMVNNHLEFVHRLLHEPRKQFGRCFNIVRTLPGLLFSEWRRKRTRERR